MTNSISKRFDLSANRLELSAPDQWREFLRQQGQVAFAEKTIAGETLLAKGTVALAYIWGIMMQEEIKKGRTVAEVAWSTYLDADDMLPNGGGATGMMAKAATEALGYAWKHGTELITWHNAEADKPRTAQSMVGKIEVSTASPLQIQASAPLAIEMESGIAPITGLKVKAPVAVRKK